MTAPTATGAAAVAAIGTDMAAVQARIAQIKADIGAPAVSGSDFASALSDASSTAGGGTASAFAVASGGSIGSGASVGSGSGVSGAQVVADAKKYLGIPYVWGGESSSGMDCSGLVQQTYKDLGINLPRVAADQQRQGTAVASLADAQPGDLLFFGQPAYHVAIYLGDNKLIESPEPGKTVHITDVYQTPTSIRRIVPAASADSLTSAQLGTAGVNSSVAAYAPQFAAAEAQYHLPAGMLAAVAQQESGGNAHAVSSAGAEGLMQLMPSTAAGLNADAFDPGQSIEAAAKILHSDLTQFGNSVPLALAAYNAGAGAVRRYGGIPPFSETQNYVRSITSMMKAGA